MLESARITLVVTSLQLQQSDLSDIKNVGISLWDHCMV